MGFPVIKKVRDGLIVALIVGILVVMSSPILIVKAGNKIRVIEQHVSFDILFSLCMILIVLLCCFSGIILHMKKQTDKKVSDTSRELKHITNSIHVCFVNFIVEKNFTISYASKGFYDMIGFNKSEVINLGNSVLSFVYPPDICKLTSLINANQEDNFQKEIRMVIKEGKVIWILFNGNLNSTRDGNRSVSAVFVDITESKLMQERLLLEEERYRVATEISNDILFEYKIEEDIMVFADKFRELYGNGTIPNFSDINISMVHLIHPEDIGVFSEYLRALRSGKEMIESEFRLCDANDNYVWCHTRGKTIYDEKKRPIRVIGKIVNIDLHKKELQTLEYKAKRDPLTNVFNKNVSRELIDQLIERYPMGNHMFMIIDIDDFKGINDKYGHLTGDKILTFIINQVKLIFNQDEILGRIGGDEFVVFISNITCPSVITEKAKLLQAALRSVYEDVEGRISVSGSIGVSMYPNDGSSYNELLSCADKALYSVKEEGKDGYKLFV